MNSQSRIKKIITFFVIVVFIVFAYYMVSAYSNRVSAGYADSAGFMELVGKNGLTEPLKSSYFASVQQLFSLYGESSDRICALIPESYSGSISVFRGHPYLIAVFGAGVSWITNLRPDLVAALMILGSTLMGLAALSVFLWKNKVSKIVIALFVFTISCYPVLMQSLLGQPYFDRMMFGPGITLFLLAWWTKYKSIAPWRWLCFLTFVLALTSERGAALAGLISVGYLFLLHGKKVFTQRELRYILISGCVSLLYYYFWSRFVQYSAMGGKISFQNFPSRLQSLFSELNVESTKTFFIVSATFILMSLFSGRGFLLVVIGILPNLLISVGGAELTGFTTHYHQIYLPMLLGASAIGFLKVSQLIKQIKNQFAVVAIEIMAVIIFLIISVNFSFSRVFPYYNTSTMNDAAALWFPTSQRYNGLSEIYEKEQSEIANYVKKLGLQNVSAPEDWYPDLYLSGIRAVQYWPYGVGTADVVIAPYIDGALNVLPHVDPQGSTESLRSCVQYQLDQHYTLKRSINDRLKIYTKLG